MPRYKNEVPTIRKVCPTCGKGFDSYLSLNKIYCSAGCYHSGYKMSAEARLKMSINHADFSGEKHPMFGRHHTEESKAKISKNKTGKCCGSDNPFFGRRHSEETKAIIRKKKTGHINSMEARQKMSMALKGKPKTAEHKAKTISQWDNKEWADRQVKLQRQGMNIMPNRPETIVMNILNKHFPNEWQYTGDGKIIIERLNPDFVNVNGRKLIIEVFGDYWHTERARKYHNTEKGRIEVYQKYGYRTLVIWESDINKDPDKVLSIIKQFCYEGLFRKGGEKCLEES